MPPSLLLRADALPLRPAHAVQALGRVVVLAPHPDDESLGCGGLLALAQAAGLAPAVVFVTDGTRSHPNSRTHPAPVLRAVREAEAHAAAEALGLPARQLTFLRLGDCAIPAPHEPAFPRAVEALDEALAERDPQTLLVPWRRDPHGDHEATWHLVRTASARLPTPPRWIEYPVWAWTQAAGAAAPQVGEADAWRLDVRSVVGQKEAAIAAHRSQTTDLIADDPEGFRLSPGMLEFFQRPWELYLEPAALDA